MLSDAALCDTAPAPSQGLTPPPAAPPLSAQELPSAQDQARRAWRAGPHAVALALCTAYSAALLKVLLN